MCVDSLPEDFSRSRYRWYDLPAILLLHRPLRCKLCDRRYYSFRKQRTIGVLPFLWMHYAIVIAVACVAVGVYQLRHQLSADATQASTNTAPQLSGQATPGVTTEPAVR